MKSHYSIQRNRLRVLKALKDYARNFGLLSMLPIVQKRIWCLLALAGNQSWSRKNIIAIGNSILDRQGVAVCAPLCIDYSVRAESQKSGFIASAHLSFIRQMKERLVGSPLLLNATLLVPDDDIDSLGLCKRFGKEHIRSCVQFVEEAAKETAHESGISIAKMSDCLSAAPLSDLLPAFQSEWFDGLMVRIAKGHRLLRLLPLDEAKVRAKEMALQYLHLASYAKANKMIVLTHSTPNMLWYLYGGAGFIENPVLLSGE